MPRIRTIKPEIWTDPWFVDRSPFAKLLFIGMWNFADDYGVLGDEPRRLKMQILPEQDVDIDALLDELVDTGGKVRRATTPEGDRVLVIRNFQRHQKIDKRSNPQYGDPEAFTFEERSRVEKTPSDQEEHESPRVPPNPAEPSTEMGKEVEVGSGSGSGSGREVEVERERAATSAAPSPTSNGRRPRDPIWDALAEIFGQPANSNERGRRNRAVKLLREANATPEEIHRRHENYPRVFGDAACTDMAIANQWSNLNRDPPASKRTSRHRDAFEEYERRYGDGAG